MKKVKKDEHVIGESVNQAEDQKDQGAEELKNRLARALADYDNLAKRFSKQQYEVIIRANKNLLEDLLPVLDNLERAQSHLQDKGLQMAIDELHQILQEYSLEEIAIEGEFDSSQHEAIDSIEGGEKGKIAKVVTKGYCWRDGVVLRPAKVVVYSGKQPS